MAHPGIKVMHIITRLDKGGSAENTMLSALGLARRGYDVVIVRGDPRESGMSAEEEGVLDSSLREAAGLGIKVVMVRSLIRRVHPLYDLRALWIFFRLIRREKPDIVHTHTSKAGILGRIAARLAGVGLIIHQPHGHVFYGHYGPSLTAVFTLSEKWVSTFTHRIITLTDRGIEEYVEHGVGKREQYVAIPSGIDLEAVKRRSRPPADTRAGLALDPSCRVVGTVGKMFHVKGQTHLVSAASLVKRDFPEARFVIVGEGPLEGNLKRQAEALGLNGYLFFAGAWGEKAWDWINAFDVFVLPSINEGMGRVLVEAMALGKPVVATRAGGIPDVVVDGKTGMLVPSGDPKALADAIRRLLEDPDLRHRMGEEGRNRADSRFSAETMVDQIDQLYREITVQPKRSSHASNADGGRTVRD